MQNRKAPKAIFLVDERARKTAMGQLMDLPADGSMKVVFSGAKDKSTRQRGLQWLWYGDVVKSGIGGRDEETENRLHLTAKYRWCLPIQVRDDDYFAALWLSYYEANKHDPRKLEWFVDHHVSTEDLNQAQMAEYLTNFQNYYALELGVNLTDPEEKGWRNLLTYEKAA
jgi:hypothetical protein